MLGPPIRWGFTSNARTPRVITSYARSKYGEATQHEQPWRSCSGSRQFVQGGLP
jgi:hypothetical protein